MNRIMTLLREGREQYDELHSHHLGQSRRLHGPWHVCTFDIASIADVEHLDVTDLGAVEGDENGEGAIAFDPQLVGYTLNESMRNPEFVKPIRMTLEQCKMLQSSPLMQAWEAEQGVSTSNPD